MFIHVTNYAEDSGIYSVGASVFFAVAYTPFFGLFTVLALKSGGNVYWGLAFFSLIRVVSFIMRTILAASSRAAENLNFVIAFEIIFDIGYLILLYIAHGLVLDLEYISTRPLSSHPILRNIRNRHVFHALLFVAVALAIVAGTTVQTEGDGPNRISNILNIVSTMFFLVLTILQLFQTLVFVRMELSDLEPLTIIQNQYTSTSSTISPSTVRSFGRRNCTYILLVISLLFLIREVFSAATMRDWDKENQESLWFPFEALPELLAVCFYAIPDLVPSEKEIKEGKMRAKMDVEVIKEDGEGSGRDIVVMHPVVDSEHEKTGVDSDADAAQSRGVEGSGRGELDEEQNEVDLGEVPNPIRVPVSVPVHLLEVEVEMSRTTRVSFN